MVEYDDQGGGGKASLTYSPRRKKQNNSSYTTGSSMASAAAPAKRIRNEEEEQNTDVVTLPNELWMRAFTYLDQKDLFLIANVNRKFLSASSADLLWKVICHRRWKNKRFNVSRFARRANCDDSEGELNDGRVEYCATLLRQFQNTLNKGLSNIVRWDRIPPLNINESERHEPKSWKESYIMAEIDSRRTVISRQELMAQRILGWSIFRGRHIRG